MSFISIFTSLFALITLCSVQAQEPQQPQQSVEETQEIEKIEKVEEPQNLLPTASGEVVAHTHYTISYSEPDEQAEWVFYTLTPDMLTEVAASRTDNFREDPTISTQSATLADYAGSGYDRGHLCPAASMACSSEAMSESFYLSNMSPQLPAFNRGRWKNLEEHVRNLAVADSILYVVTGPILSDSLGSIGSNEVTIPRYYYKVLYSPKKEAMVAYLMENTKLSAPLDTYATTVDEVELKSGIDFFAEIDDTVADLESEIDLSLWQAEGYNTTAKSDESSEEPTQKQCQGKTSSGKRCSRKAQEGSPYCWQHQK